jgi:hypothetical protein
MSWPARFSGMTSDNSRRAANTSARISLALTAEPPLRASRPDSAGAATRPDRPPGSAGSSTTQATSSGREPQSGFQPASGIIQARNMGRP